MHRLWQGMQGLPEMSMSTNPFDEPDKDDEKENNEYDEVDDFSKEDEDIESED